MSKNRNYAAALCIPILALVVYGKTVLNRRPNTIPSQSTSSPIAVSENRREKLAGGRVYIGPDGRIWVEQYYNLSGSSANMRGGNVLTSQEVKNYNRTGELPDKVREFLGY